MVKDEDTRASALAKSIRRVMESTTAEAEGQIAPVVLTRLKRSVVASLAFIEEAVARGHHELRQDSPNVVTVQVAGRAAVAVLQGTGVLPQFHVVDGRTMDVGQLADAVARAEALRQALVERASALGIGGEAGSYEEGAEPECDAVETSASAGGPATGRGGPGARPEGVVISPHLNGAKTEVLSDSDVSRETQEGVEDD